MQEALPFISDEKEKQTLLKMEATFKARQQKIQQVKEKISSVKEMVNTTFIEPTRTIIDNKISQISTRIPTKNTKGNLR